MLAHCNLKENMWLCSKLSSFFPFMHCPLVANQKTRWSITNANSNELCQFRFIDGSEKGPVVVAVKVARNEVTVDISQLNPSIDENSVVDVRSVDSENPATVTGYFYFLSSKNCLHGFELSKKIVAFYLLKLCCRKISCVDIVHLGNCSCFCLV